MKIRVSTLVEMTAVCLALTLGVFAAESRGDDVNGSDAAVSPLPPMSEPASLVLLATALGLSARQLRRRSGPDRKSVV